MVFPTCTQRAPAFLLHRQVGVHSVAAWRLLGSRILQTAMQLAALFAAQLDKPPSHSFGAPPPTLPQAAAC